MGTVYSYRFKWNGFDCNQPFTALIVTHLLTMLTTIGYICASFLWNFIFVFSSLQMQIYYSSWRIYCMCGCHHKYAIHFIWTTLFIYFFLLNLFRQLSSDTRGFIHYVCHMWSMLSIACVFSLFIFHFYSKLKPLKWFASIT